MSDDALIKLAKITRVEAHKRRSKSGKSEQVDSYLRKVLDKFGVGGDEKTKKGAFQTGGETGRQSVSDETANRKIAGVPPKPSTPKRNLNATDVSSAKPGDRAVLADGTYMKKEFDHSSESVWWAYSEDGKSNGQTDGPYHEEQVKELLSGKRKLDRPPGEGDVEVDPDTYESTPANVKPGKTPGTSVRKDQDGVEAPTKTDDALAKIRAKKPSERSKMESLLLEKADGPTKSSIIPAGSKTDQEKDKSSSGKLDPDAETAPPSSTQPKGTSAFSNDQMFVKSDGDLWESLETGQKVSTKDLPGDTEVYYQPGAEGKLGQRSNASKAEMAQMKNNFSKKRVQASGPLFTDSEVRLLRLSGVTKDDIDTVISLGSTASLDRSPKKNWVENSGDLPAYIREVANSLHSKRGMPISKAIPVAISRIKVWARGGDGVEADTVAKAVKALAQWEALKARNKARSASK